MNSASSRSSKMLRILAWGLGGILLAGTLLYFFWFRPVMQTPLAQPMSLPTRSTQAVPTQSAATPGVGTPVAAAATPVPTMPTSTPKPPICGSTNTWQVLLVGIDYEGEGYLYGLSDVIRLVRVDFTIPQVNVVALPRASLAQVPPNRLIIPGPILLNQAYFFGTAAMGHYVGTGYGAGSLAETIQYNFGVNADHYIVVNFNTFIKFVDSIGGIEVDLPTYVDDRPRAFFPAGKQTLAGAQALSLARVRMKYSDLVRIDNQSIVINAIFNRLKDPRIIAKFPDMYTAFKDSVITDFSPNQIQDALCLFSHIQRTNINFFDPPSELLTGDWGVFIPTMNKDMFVYHWDQSFIDWINASLAARPK